MGIPNRRPDLNGILVVDKPRGWTSADVCRRLRSLSGGAKVGHAGTLDPLATGVLVVCFGRATKLVERIMGLEKVYRAQVDLSAFSTTDDEEGERQPVEVVRRPSETEIARVLTDGFLGEVEQRPPIFSASMVDGRRAYKRARAGEEFRPAVKRIRIDSIDVLSYAWPTLDLRIECGRGTYIRSIARDLGEALATGGMLTGLIRERVGPFVLEDAVGVDEVPESFGPEVLIPDLESASQE